MYGPRKPTILRAAWRTLRPDKARLTGTVEDVADLRAKIEALGGLAQRGDLAQHFGISKQAVSLWRKDPTFPPPVTRVGGRDVWAIAHVEGWRRERADRREAFVRSLQPREPRGRFEDNGISRHG